MGNGMNNVYESIIRDLFIIMLVLLIYLILSHQWFISIAFGVLVFGSYAYVNKRIKKIKKL